MTKKDIVLKIADTEKELNSKCDLTQNQIANVVQKTLDYISDELSSGNRIELRNFGVFEPVIRKSRKGRNPNKPENEVIIPEHAVAKFKPGKKLKNSVNQLNILKIN
ncbi:MAG TPA: HU family DNA-binding protein [Victivallales bacterium]|nr:HU family DNA-binding protein [Victivallales bacterium]